MSVTEPGDRHPMGEYAHNSQLLTSKIWLHIQLVVLGTLFILAYYDTFVSFVRTWSGRDDYSHGFIVPLVSLYFVYVFRHKLAGIPVRPRLGLGAVVVAIGALMLLLGSIGSVVMVQQMSILVMLPGLVLMLLGTGFLMGLALPLAYLVLMVPAILDVTMGPLHWPFQLFGAAVASEILTFVGIPVYRTGQFLELPNITLEVANVCSGVRYLVSILAISVPLAFLTQKTVIRKVMLIMFGLFVGVVVNPVRISLIGLWMHGGGEGVHGPSHLLHGLFVSQVGFVFLFLGAWALSGPGDAGSAERETERKKEETVIRPWADDRMVSKAWIAALVMLLCTVALLYFYTPRPERLSGSLDDLPLTVAGWRGEDIRRGDLVTLEGADSRLNRIYRKSPASEIWLFIGYFEMQGQGRELIEYRLSNYYKDAVKVEIPIGSGTHIPANKTVMIKEGHRVRVLYWYDINGKAIADRYEAKLATALGGLLHRRTSGAKIAVFYPLKNGQDQGAALEEEKEFVKALFPHLARILSRDASKG